MNYNLITHFFKNPNEYIDFLVKRKKVVRANEEGTCFAELIKTTDEYWTYSLIWAERGQTISEYVQPFRASIENVDTFNKGCKIMAERLQIYLETGDASLVPTQPGAFGELVYKIPPM